MPTRLLIGVAGDLHSPQGPSFGSARGPLHERVSVCKRIYLTVKPTSIRPLTHRTA